MNETNRIRQFGLAGLTSFALSFSVGACFNGANSEGLPCDESIQCAIGQECINGFCNGVYICEDETVIDALDLCNLEVDCPSGEDEFGCEGINLNECSDGEDGPDIAYEAWEPVGMPLNNPLDVQATQLVGPLSADFLVGASGATQLDLISYGDAGDDTAPMVVPVGPFDGRTVVDFKLGDVSGDNKQDIIVATQGSMGVAVYVYENNAPGMPMPFGPPLEVTLPGGLVPDIQAIELGRLNNDSSTDMVAIVDAGMLGAGRLLVSLGDSAAPASDGSYFTPQLLDGIAALDYSIFFDMVMADFDNDGLDDVIVSGQNGNMPGLWLIRRTGEDILSGWEGPFSLGGLMIPGAEVAVGNFSASSGPDLALIDPMNGKLQTLINMNGMLVGGPILTIEGGDPTGITLSDLNCDNNDDFIYYQDDTVAVLLGDGEGSVLSLNPIITELEGLGRGGIAVTVFDIDGEDDTPDLVTTLEGGSTGLQLVMSTGFVED